MIQERGLVALVLVFGKEGDLMVKSLLCLAKSLLCVHVPFACAQIFQERPQIFLTLFWYNFPSFFFPFKTAAY